MYVDIKNLYLGNPLKLFEYIHTPLDPPPPNIQPKNINYAKISQKKGGFIYTKYAKQYTACHKKARSRKKTE